jgi:hypothetical protein
MIGRYTRAVVRLTVVAVMAGAMTMVPATAAAEPLIDCVSADNGDANLLSVSFTPAVVDVTHGPVEVTLRATVADTGGPGDASGVVRVEVDLDRRPFRYEPDVVLAPQPGGEWVATFTFGRRERPTRWRVAGVTLTDRARNEGFYGYGGEDLGSVPGAHVLSVANNTPDVTRPQILKADFSPSRVRTAPGPRPVRFTVRARDTGSGVADVRVGLYRERGPGIASAVLRRVPGMPRVFRGRVWFDPWSRPGRWRVEYLAVWDRASNSRLVQNVPALQRLGVDDRITVISRKDDTQPRISRLSFVPEVADVRTSNETVTVSMRVRDSHAGVRRVLAYLADPLEVNPFLRLELVSGTTRDGVWEDTMRVQQCPARTGRMRAFVFAADRQGNRTFYRPKQLRGLGFKWQLRLLARPDAVIEPSEVTHEPHVPPVGPLALSFPEIVNGITSDSALVRRVPRREGTPLGPAVPGTWTCTDDQRRSTDCAVGKVHHAAFHPALPLTTRRTYAVVLNPEHFLSVTDLAGNPYDRDDYSFKIVAP